MNKFCCACAGCVKSSDGVQVCCGGCCQSCLPSTPGPRRTVGHKWISHVLDQSPPLVTWPSVFCFLLLFFFSFGVGGVPGLCIIKGTWAWMLCQWCSRQYVYQIVESVLCGPFPCVHIAFSLFLPLSLSFTVSLSPSFFCLSPSFFCPCPPFSQSPFLLPSSTTPYPPNKNENRNILFVPGCLIPGLHVYSFKNNFHFITVAARVVYTAPFGILALPAMFSAHRTADILLLTS